jgi:dTMP kinase
LGKIAILAKEVFHMRGKFIVIEGGDCSGKSTFARFLMRRHPAPEFCHTNEPGGNPYGMEIRKLILDTEGAEESDNLTKFHLYWASKVENFRKVIFPSLDNGITVISDRFEGSTFAYQISEDYRLEKLFWQTREACLRRIVPVYLYFDVDAETQIARARMRSGEQNYFDTRGVEYRQKICRAYRRFFDDRRIISYKIDSSLSKDKMVQSAYSVFKEIVGL